MSVVAAAYLIETEFDIVAVFECLVMLKTTTELVFVWSLHLLVAIHVTCHVQSIVLDFGNHPNSIEFADLSLSDSSSAKNFFYVSYFRKAIDMVIFL